MTIYDFWLPAQSPNTSRYLLNASEDAHTLYVLCHGWHGDLTGTWGSLAQRFLDGNFIQSADLLFLGFERNPSGADLLADWLARVIPAVFPAYSYSRRTERTIERNYSRLILVGHSLGAIALRGAVQKMHKAWCGDDASDICRQAQMCLYAPPLRGVVWKDYLKEFTSLAARVVRTTIRGVDPVSEDLASGSTYLENLRHSTNDILSSGEEYPRAHLVLAMQDRVVEVRDIEEFKYSDDSHRVINGATHTSVCKVRRAGPCGAMAPIEELVLG